MNDNKPRFDSDIATRVAADLLSSMQHVCEKIVVAGSLRRGKSTVGDIELVYIPKFDQRKDPDNMFGMVDVNLADELILHLEKMKVLKRRKNSLGSTVFGAKNKLMRHFRTQIPIDFFSTTPDCWHNYLVCRTGPAESNARIATRAKERGYRWNPYGPGFTHVSGRQVEMHSEKEVFEFVNLPYLEPKQRI